MLIKSPVRNRSRVSTRVLIFALAATLAPLLALTRRASAAEAQHAMVVAESGLAAKAGINILQHGGNAIDAATATTLTLGVTNASSCGIGGGGFMLIYLAKTGRFYALDFRERASMHASADMYLRGGHADEQLARRGPLAVAVPGEVAGLEAALERFGTMKFQQVAAPAIRLASDGFPVSKHLAAEIARHKSGIAADPGLRAIYLNPDGSPARAGQTITDPALASTLRRLGDKPLKNFYHGPIARRIAAYMKENGGIVDAQDLALYEPIWRTPLNRPFQGYEVYTMPPPSSGGVILEMLGMLEPGHLPGLGLNSQPYLARLIEVMRQGFIDRQQYADPVYVHVPIGMLLSPGHINEARARALHHAAPAPVAAAHDHGTSNLCVVDSAGNVVVLTTTINTGFGAMMMIPKLGLILNNEMDDFASELGVANVFRLRGVRANGIAPGKRPLSSMSPAVVTKGGRPVLALGGSGGPTIITGVLQVTLDVLDFNLPPAKAVAAPRIHEQGKPATVFVDPSMPAATVKGLSAMGYPIKVVPWMGAVGAIEIAPNNLLGAFDPRKGGGVEGY
ncbi:MAG: gamma-glutamyltransferase [Candidatus Binataceae bacterium]